MLPRWLSDEKRNQNSDSVLELYIADMLQLMDASLDLDASSAAVEEIEALQNDIDDLKDKVKRLRDESQQVRAEVLNLFLNSVLT